MTETDHIWYVGYGSNLLRERFNCYITGGQFRLGGSIATGCSDKTLPLEDKPITIPYEMFFAKESKSWENGGVAFISTEKNEDKKTFARMWKITSNQFLEIWRQEGPRWYNVALYLGQNDNVPIITITNNSKFKHTKPSGNYLKTIVEGLRETHRMEFKETLNYLIKTLGIKNNLKKEELGELINSTEKL